jgi:hypothetical protein
MSVKLLYLLARSLPLAAASLREARVRIFDFGPLQQAYLILVYMSTRGS